MNTSQHNHKGEIIHHNNRKLAFVTYKRAVILEHTLTFFYHYIKQPHIYMMVVWCWHRVPKNPVKHVQVPSE